MSDRDKLIKLTEKWEEGAAYTRGRAHEWAVRLTDKRLAQTPLKDLRETLIAMEEKPFITLAEAWEGCAAEARDALADEPASPAPA